MERKKGFQRQRVFEALGTARSSVEAFNGSEETSIRLVNDIAAYEQVLWDYFGERFPPAEEEQRLAHFQLTRKDSVTGLLEHAISSVYGMLARLGSLREQLKVLEMGGALVKYYDDVFVLADTSPDISGDGAEPKNPHEFIRQPRLAILVKLLHGLEIYSDDLIIRVGTIFEDKIRQLPYVLIDIPRIGRQIAICDQYGQVTFVSQGIQQASFWAGYSKSEIKKQTGVKAVPFDRLADMLGPLLFGSIPAAEAIQTRPKRDIRAYESEVMKTTRNDGYSCEQVIEWARHHKQITSKYPTSVSGIVLQSPCRTWAGVSTYLRKRHNTTLLRLLEDHDMINRPDLDLPRIYRA
ncbi:MAG TPA: hypothetical protein VHB73_06470, partial [Alphaproteobacteria bacterium]|nr:hypothetical protein [Alphaproteobacteria bacterium]